MGCFEKFVKRLSKGTPLDEEDKRVYIDRFVKGLEREGYVRDGHTG